MNVRDKYINFFIKHNHALVPSAPLVPENDPSVLFNTAGMQPLTPYLKGQPHPLGRRLCSYQACLRTNDLEEVGDTTHHTFFEMLGNWSLGDYFKKESLTWSFEFLTQDLSIPLDKLAVTVFKGNDFVNPDDEAANIWRALGVPDSRIQYLGVDDNWWPNMEMIGPCGPDSEIFYWTGTEPAPTQYDPEDNRWVEIWNNVFMQYAHNEDDSFTELPNKNVDTGMGLERITAVLEGVADNYASSLWRDIIAKIEEISGVSYESNKKAMRIIADHIRSAVFISADNAGIKPSNTDQGYILRRLIRRAIRYARSLNIDLQSNWAEMIAEKIMDKYAPYYPEIAQNRLVVLEVLKDEKNKFSHTLENGLKEFEKITAHLTEKHLNKDLAFKLYDTYGFPLELTTELAAEQGITVDEKGFNEKLIAHQEKSRAASKDKFKGGLAGDGIMETKYHTTTHLLNAALKIVVNQNIHQRGSNITAERMRFDFNCDHKLTDEEKVSVETLVNQWISESLPITSQQMPKEEALKTGAECLFIERYPDIVSVYSIGDVSSELCGGPHMENTNQLGTFKIKKEEAVSAGVRRIKAVLID